VSPALLAARLNEAARAGMPMTVVYRDGYRETTHRILPVAATERVLRARDLASNEMRVFLLSHLEILEELEQGPSPAAPTPPSEADVLAAAAGELRLLGWHVMLSNERLHVHGRHASGQPLTVPTASIARHAETPGRLPRRLRRPWTVVGPGIPRARSFADLDKAMALFMTTARAHAPLRRRQPPTTRSS